jgi:branched-chain amino acid transport system permease protein
MTGTSAAAAPTLPAIPGAVRARRIVTGLLVAVVYIAITWFIARSDINIQGLALVAAVFGMLALSLDLVAGTLGLYSLGVGGFFAIGAYSTTLLATNLGINVFLLLPLMIVVTGAFGIIIGAASLRVSGLYFAITTFIFTLVITVLATDLQITNGMQGLLGPDFPAFPDALAPLGSSIAWAVMLALFVTTFMIWSIRRSPFYPTLLAIRDAEPFAEAAGIRAAPIKIAVFGFSAAIVGCGGWLFCFLGVVSPSQFNWSVSLNVLVMVLLGGINTTFGPLIGAAFVSMFPVVVSINPWLQEIVYGAISILAITVFPEGVVGLAKRSAAMFAGGRAPWARETSVSETTTERLDVAGEAAVGDDHPTVVGHPPPRVDDAAPPESGAVGDIAIECRDITFGYPTGPRVLRNVSVAIRRGHIHGLIGPNGSGKSTLANIIAGGLRPAAGTVTIKGQRVERQKPPDRAGLGLRRTFQAAQLVGELTTRDNVLVGAYALVPGIARRATVWPLLHSARRDLSWMQGRAADALGMVGAADWTEHTIADVPHGIEQLTQLASVCVADPDIIVLDEPATGLSAREVAHLGNVLGALKARGITMVIIEHQTRFLFPLCDQVTVLNAGEVILTGSADEVRAHPVVRKVYLGE